MKIIINTKTPKTALRISDSFYPGWEIFIDNNQSSVYMADGMVKGTIVNGTGSHIIELKYKPRSFYIGSAISIFTLIVILLYFFKKFSSYFL